ncbi:glucosamine-6-phosphate deaminase [Caproiciproducens faecalis]|uniref:Glucosamine-6-phosphate deaminase n=1 Tax=Caproiciproducens faecalis TaxID=2820301 RepID=A0ABS7DKH2_9FIRM|nr:glucosamine-6-phosphate deaminase [Caproiciproducens faecalis]MBW7571800.1 glucosamine-6-phosphate deaminase [Caproiciproducens faecalis]
MKIISAPDYQSMSRKAANIISAQVILFPNSVLGLATGSTPLGVYQQLIEWYKKDDIDFSKVHSVNLDEYCGLSGEHEQSYRYYMNTNFFNHVNLPIENTNVPNGLAKDIDAECKRYDNVITSLGGIDLQLLGIGHTGHIGFNEPDDDFDKTTHCVKLNQKTIEANARFFENAAEVPQHALTMGIKAIMQAKKLLLVANGSSKAEVLCRSLFGPITPEVPASILQLHNDLTVVADAEALAVIRQQYPSAIG